MPLSTQRLERVLAPGLAIILALLACSLPGTPTEPPALPTEPAAPPDTPVPEPTPVELSSGSDYSLGAGLCFDLDGGLAVACGAAEADFQFLVEETASTAAWAIVPLGSAQIRSLGMEFESAEPPTEEMCSAHPLVSEPLDLLPMAEIFWNCYQTGEGHVGWLKAHAWVPGDLRFSWTTFSLP